MHPRPLPKSVHNQLARVINPKVLAPPISGLFAQHNIGPIYCDVVSSFLQ